MPSDYGEVDTGDYTLKMEGAAAEEPFSVVETFTIEDEEAEEAEENNPDPEEPEEADLPLWTWILIETVFLLLAFFIGRKSSKKPE
ncbi:hypothetical protein [Alkalicoccus halolimnae]|uniref:Uncharacterized protein n=1 Tax=Alkalicoccus halolimnae TaxID=1667239 RepID=A0A5C7FAQ7_9BACI|nr:hypothetical protein [Alkalicoccus halolimnae]TXF83310.1 hypothetical protein FTX54_13105 [Alkalicoccus halolimnae]